MNTKRSLQPSSFLLYTAVTGDIKVDVRLEDETVWLTQKGMGELFGVESHTINYHLKDIYVSGELQPNATTRKIRVVREEGNRQVGRELDFYNLDAIISVGYRVNSHQATQFRIWATKTLKEFMIKGFVLDDVRLKQGKQFFGKDYFDELIERIREIRASERRFYQKITDIYSLAVDYDKNAPRTQEFFATVQNKLHWAITGKTSAEIIYQSVNAHLPNMGLATWKNAPSGKILKSDTHIAKNYLQENHIKELERIVSAYLDLAENRAQRQIVMNMAAWAQFLDSFLELSNYPILADKGRVSAEEARLKAEQEFNVFRIEQDKNYLSDFDQVVQKITKKKEK